MVASGASAQFVPTLDGQDRVCPGRPQQPAWIEAGDVRDAHKGRLVQEMYRAQSLRAVTESGDCSCASRFPSWTSAESDYLATYAGLDRHAILAATSDYKRTANGYRQEAMAICRAQGNW